SGCHDAYWQPQNVWHNGYLDPDSREWQEAYTDADGQYHEGTWQYEWHEGYWEGAWHEAYCDHNPEWHDPYTDTSEEWVATATYYASSSIASDPTNGTLTPINSGDHDADGNPTGLAFAYTPDTDFRGL